jgi:RNA polymerase sigma-70 factor (ECF subfamily)
MISEPSDAELVNRSQAGDGDAFGRLVERHYDLIFRLSFRLLGRRSDAEDLTQDICVGLPRKLAGFRGDAKFTTWLYRVTANAAIDQLRKSASQTRATETWGELELIHQACLEERREDLSWLRTTMSSLSWELRETVALVLGEAMTHAEVSQALQVPQGTISWRMSEVKKALRALAKEEERAG